MQMGFNNDVIYQGKTLHIQTEDHGLSGKKITTQVFYAGAILDARTVSYEDEISGFSDGEERDEFIRKMMKAMHRSYYRRIQAHQYAPALGLEVPDGENAAPAPATQTSAPDASDSGSERSVPRPGGRPSTSIKIAPVPAPEPPAEVSAQPALRMPSDARSPAPLGTKVQATGTLGASPLQRERFGSSDEALIVDAPDQSGRDLGSAILNRLGK